MLFNIFHFVLFVLLYFRICARRANFSHLETLGFGYSSRQDAKNAKFGNLFYFAPLRLCGKCSDSFWLRLCRAGIFAVKFISFRLSERDAAIHIDRLTRYKIAQWRRQKQHGADDILGNLNTLQRTIADG